MSLSGDAEPPAVAGELSIHADDDMEEAAPEELEGGQGIPTTDAGTMAETAVERGVEYGSWREL